MLVDKFKRRICIILLCATPLFAWGKTFTFTSAMPLPLADVHSVNSGLSVLLSAASHESLFRMNPKKFQIEGVLAQSWTQPAATTWRIAIRPGVRFHDGSVLNADDVLFSLERAKRPESGFKIYFSNVARIEKTGPLQIDIHTTAADPNFLRNLILVRIISKQWSEKNQSTIPILASKASDLAQKPQTIPIGTGPFIIERWIEGKRMEFRRNPLWWGKFTGNVNKLIYLAQPEAQKRVAGLIAGTFQLVLDPPLESLSKLRSTNGVSVQLTPEERAMFIGINLSSASINIPSQSSAKPSTQANPFRKLAVRQALYYATDYRYLERQVMAATIKPTALPVPPSAFGWSPQWNKRLPYMPDKARKLLAQAGYAQGFDTELACSDQRFVNEAEVCKALATMWAKVGIRAKPVFYSAPEHYKKLHQRDSISLYYLGWATATWDSFYTLQRLFKSNQAHDTGSYNAGNYSNAKLDAIIERLAFVQEPRQRQALMNKSWEILARDLPIVPLYYQSSPRAFVRGSGVFSSSHALIMWENVRNPRPE